MKYDDIVLHLGQFGRYQKQIYWCLCLPAISVAFQSLSSVFIMAMPDHRCALPNAFNDTFALQNEDHSNALNASIPRGKEEGFSACYLYQTANSLPSNYTVYSENTSDIMACDRWVYDESTFSSTLVTDLDLVCEQKLGRSHVQMFLMLGSFFGNLISGPPADFFGRKPVMMVSLILHSGASLALAFTPSYVYLCAFNFLNGAAFTSLYAVLFVLGMELVGPQKRVISGSVIVTLFGVGVVILSGLAFFLRDWHHLQLSTAILTVPFLSYYWLIPESTRWLVNKGRYSEAEVIIRRTARVNKKTLPAKALQFDQWNAQVKEVREPLWRIATYPRLMARAMIVYFNWAVCSMTYYGLGLNVGNLNGSIYLNSALFGVVEIASYVTCMFLLDRLGRRKLHLLSMFVAGLACTTSLFPIIFGGADYQWVTVALAIAGKFGISGAFAIMWMYSSELFPTVVRNSGVASSSIMARIGGIISPYIANLSVSIGGHLGQALPLLIFGGCSLAAGLMALLLPETKNTKLPDTLTEANDFGRKVRSEEIIIDEMEDYKCQEENGLSVEISQTQTPPC